MKKIFVLSLIVLVLAIPVSSAFAQDDMMVLAACSDEELAGTIAGITEINDGFTEIATEFDLSSDPSDNSYGETLVVLEAISSAYWTDFFPEVPACTEAVGLAFVVGEFYEEYLITGLLLNLAAWAEADGDADTATTLAEQAALHLDNINTAMQAMSAMSFEDLAAFMFATELPACSEDELTAAGEAFDAAYQALSDLEEEYADDSLALFGVSEGATYAFNTEVYPTVSTCAELDYIADVTGIALNIANSAAGLYANAEVEDAAGNTDVAEAMNAAAEAREEVFTSMLEMMGTEE